MAVFSRIRVVGSENSELRGATYPTLSILQDILGKMVCTLTVWGSLTLQVLGSGTWGKMMGRKRKFQRKEESRRNKGKFLSSVIEEW